MDFTKPAPAASHTPAEPAAPAPLVVSRYYDAALAAKLFRESGRAEHFAAGETLFAEEQKAGGRGLFGLGAAPRMYFLVEGTVAMSIAGRPLDLVSAGEIVGEMSVITSRPRSATATAKGPVKALSMDAAELHAALARQPSLAMLLMNSMFDRLSFATARLASRNVPLAPRKDNTRVFDPPLIAQLEEALPRAALVRFPSEATVMREGQTGTCMYAVKHGKVLIAVRNKVVEIARDGGSFGEMALVNQAPRTARAVTERETELLAIDRASFLATVSGVPAFGMALMRAVAERLRHVTAQVV